MKTPEFNVGHLRKHLESQDSTMLSLLKRVHASPLFYVVLYFACIFGFAIIYYFFMPVFSEAGGQHAGYWHAVYFSIVTITTLGYGDISPQSPIGKILVSSEVLIGIMIIGFFIDSVGNKIKKSAQQEAAKLLTEKEQIKLLPIHYQLHNMLDDLLNNLHPHAIERDPEKMVFYGELVLNPMPFRSYEEFYISNKDLHTLEDAECYLRNIRNKINFTMHQLQIVMTGAVDIIDHEIMRLLIESRIMGAHTVNAIDEVLELDVKNASMNNLEGFLIYPQAATRLNNDYIALLVKKLAKVIPLLEHSASLVHWLIPVQERFEEDRI